MHSMFVFLTVMQAYSCWNFTCQSGLVWEGDPNNKFGQCHFVFTRPTRLLVSHPGDLSKNQRYATLDECYAWKIYADHTWVPNRKIWDFPLFARKKDVLSSLDVFRGGRFLFAVFLTRFFREFFKSFAQTCLGTNARPLVLFKCASGCMAPAKGCTMRDVNDWHHRS